MGANAVTTVPVYTAGEVLTAADMNITNSGIPVFATTVTRDAAFGGTGEKTLAEGQFAYIEATNTTQYYDGAAWQSVGASGLTLIKTQTIGTTVGSVTVSDAFSTTYDAYKITITGGVGSGNANLGMILGATATGYYYGLSGATYGGAANTAGAQNATSWPFVGNSTANTIQFTCEIFGPFLTKMTTITASYLGLETASSSNLFGGMLNNSTSYTAFTVTPASGTLTGGTIRVYGYANS